MRYPLAPNGIFWTLQGEGALAGEPMVFVRLAGCSVGCAQCDTDYRVSRRLDAQEIVREARDITPLTFTAPWVWITGGEPTDHDLTPLVEAFKADGFLVALATSGKRDVSHLRVNWLSVSPHTREIAQQSGHELKAVPGLNGLTWDDVRELERLSFPWRYVQPMDGDPATVQQCIEWAMQHPGWRLTLQQHKLIGLP